MGSEIVAGTAPECKKQAVELFNSLAGEYATEREQMPLFQPQLKFMLSALANEHGAILDLGCAAGSEVASLMDHGFAITGVDLSFAMLRAAHHRFSSRAGPGFCRADAEHLPIKSDSMDGVVCLGLLEYLEDYTATVKEVHRVLRNGGLAVFTVPSKVSIFAVLERVSQVALVPLWRLGKRLLRPNFTPAKSIPPHRRNLCVPWRLRQLLRNQDFAVERSGVSAYMLYPLDRIPRLNVAAAKLLNPLCHVPILRYGASVYMVAARKIHN